MILPTKPERVVLKGSPGTTVGLCHAEVPVIRDGKVVDVQPGAFLGIEVLLDSGHTLFAQPGDLGPENR